jgi:hypothetical protein
MTSELSHVPFTDFLSESSFLKASRLAESAWIQHVPFAFWLTEQVKPKLLVELGVHTGVSYFAFCQSVRANNLATLCYGIDTWTGDAHAGLYDESVWLDVSSFNTSAYAAFSYLLKTSFNEALPYFDDGSISLLHIDGYHTYEAVKNDFESWLPKMAAHGIVVFHDIVVREREFGVYKLWSELKQQYKTFEFLHGHGLGILALGEVSSDRLMQLFNLQDAFEISKVQSAYASLGAGQAESYHTTMLHNQFTQLHALYASLQAQYELLNSEHEGLKKLMANSQVVPTASEPESSLLSVLPKETL